MFGNYGWKLINNCSIIFQWLQSVSKCLIIFHSMDLYKVFIICNLFHTNRNSIRCKIFRKTVTTIWIWLDLIWFRKTFSLCGIIKVTISPWWYNCTCFVWEKNDGKILKYIFMTILGLAESFTTMNRPDPTITLFDGLFLGKCKWKGRWFVVV